MQPPHQPPIDVNKDTSADASPDAAAELTAVRPRTARTILLDPSWPSLTSVFRVVVLAMVLIFAGVYLRDILTALSYFFFLLVIAVFIAYLLAPLVNLIRRPFAGKRFDRLMPRPLAILLAYTLVFTALTVGVVSLAPQVAEQGKEFGNNLPAYASSIRRSFNDMNRRFDRLRIPEEVQAKINDQAILVGESITTWFGVFLWTAILYLPGLVLIPILSFFFLKDFNLLRLAILRMFPAGPYRMRADRILQDVNSTLASYARAQIISCVLIGTVCTIGFYVIGLKYALLLGILAGVFEFVPLLGPASLAIIAVSTAAFSDQPWRAFYVAAFLLILRGVHDYVTYPRIVRGGIHLHPVMIILSVVAGEQIAGIPGVFLAIPVVAIITVLYRNIVEHRGKNVVAELLDAEAVTVEKL